MSAKSKKSVAPARAAAPSKPVAGRRVYTSQFKREAVELVEREGVSVAESARLVAVGGIRPEVVPQCSGGRRGFFKSGASGR